MKWIFIFSVNFDKINLDNDKNVDRDDSENIIHVILCHLVAYNPYSNLSLSLLAKKVRC